MKLKFCLHTIIYKFLKLALITIFFSSCTFDVDIQQLFDLEKIELISEDQVLEGQEASFIFKLPPGGEGATIKYKITHKETDDNDFDSQSINGSFVINENNASNTIALNIIDDNTFEQDESFTVNFVLSHPEVNQVFSASKTITIKNINPLPKVRFTNTSINENDGLSSFSLIIDGQSQEPIHFDITLNSGSANSGDDFSSWSDSVELNQGESAYNFNVNIINDTLDEIDEVFSFSLSNLVNLDDSEFNSPEITIIDDDNPPNATIADLTVIEGSTNQVLIALSQISGQDITFNYTMAPGTALATSDYIDSSGTVTIPAGNLSVPIPINTVDDIMAESNESFTVTISNSNGNVNITDSLANITITDNEGAPALIINDVTVNESDSSVSFTVSTSVISGSNILFDWSTSDVTATAGNDYMSQSQTGEILLAGNATTTITISLGSDDNLDEINETFVVNLSNPTNASISDNQGIATINDNDATPTLSIANISGAENSNQTFTVTLSAASGQDVSFDYATSDGTALAGSDYTAASGSLTLTAGSTTQTFTITISDDTLNEANETYTATISNPSNATISTASATGTITDNDTTPALSIANISGAEDSNQTFTVTLSAASGQDVSFDYATSDGTALAGSDYTAASGSLTLTAGSTTQTFTITISDDTLNETSETYTATISNPSHATISTSSATGTITDNDSAPTLSINDVTINESDSTVSFTVSLSAASGQDVNFDWTTADATATAGSDYTANSNSSETITAGNTSATINVSLLADDSLDEVNETFELNLSNPSNATISDSQGIATITDNDAEPTLSIADSNATEDSNLTFTINLSTASSKNVSFNYATSNGTALAGSDYTATSGSLTILAGNTSQTFTVSVTEDALDEGDETLTGSISSPTNATLTTSSATGTINDNDSTPSITNITSPAGPLRYKQTATFTVIFSEAVDVTGTPTLPLTFDSSPTSPIAKYVSGSGSSNLVFEYTILPGDSDSDGPSYGASILLNGGTILSKANASISADLSISSISSSTTIDSTFVYVNVDKVSSIMNENGGSTSFKVQLSETAYEPITVNYFLGGNTVLNTDYSMSLSSLNFGIGEQEKTITLTGLDNTNDTAIKVLNFNLIQPNNARLAEKSKIDVRINDDEGDLNFKEIASGDNHTCAINMSDKLMCWGANSSGQLGDGTTQDKNTPLLVDSSQSYKKVSAGDQFTCAITTSDVLKCWGENLNGQLGTGNTTSQTTPTVIDSGVSYKAVSVKSSHSCGITTSDALKCWGYNSQGQIGDNSTTTRLSPTVINSGTSYSFIGTGSYHTCAITSANALHCWGDNSSGQLGDGTTNQRLTPTLIDSGTTYASVSAGGSHSCATTSTNALKCWGTNFQFQLGDGTTNQRLTPTTIDSGTSFTQVSAGSYHSCALSSANKVKCWGVNFYGELGDGTTQMGQVPQAVDSDSNYSKISIGASQSCGITSSNELKCWGANETGSMGDATSTNIREPANIDHGMTFLKVSGGSYHTCGINNANNLLCWGRNSYHQLGDGTTISKNYPTPIESSFQFKEISSNLDQSCAITTNDELFCWGDNYIGQLGDGTTVEATIPKAIDSGVTYKSISNGGIHTCGITTSDVLKCWGANYNGRLGDGTTTVRYSPTVIDSGVSYKVISAGGGSTCGITTSDVLKCWGNNTSYQVGDGTTIHRLSPVIVDSGTSYSSVYVGSSHACGITTSNILKCWGNNLYGKIGDGTTTHKTTPTIIDSGTSYNSIALGYNSTCGVTSTQKLKCWGANNSGQIGDGTNQGKTTPVLINSSQNYSQVFAGYSHMCALSPSNQLSCWGSDGFGQSGGRGNFIHHPGQHSSLSINNITVNESDSTATFTVTLTESLSDKSVTFSWETVDGTATAGNDYTSNNNTETLLPGETTKSITINLLADDALDEIDETFSVQLLSANNAGISTSLGTATITDNDATPSLSINDTSSIEGNSVNFTVTLSSISGQDIDFDWYTTSNTASAPSDYTAVPTTTVTIPAGTPSVTLNVTTSNNNVDDGDRNFQAWLTSPVNASIADSSGIGTITDEDVIQLQIADTTAGESDGTGSLVVSTVGGITSPSPISFDFYTETTGATATAGNDYTEITQASPQSSTITSGLTSTSISVTLLSDNLDEFSETVIVKLINPVNATLSDDSADLVLTDDDAEPTLNIPDPARVNEGNSVTFTPTLSEVSGKNVTYHWTTFSGTASASLDYTAASGDPTITAGSLSNSHVVSTLTDANNESDEVFAVILSSITHAQSGDLSGHATINDAGAPTLSIANITVLEDGSMDFIVSLTASHAHDVTFDLNTADGTATAGSDYTAVSGNYTIASGNTSTTVNVPVTDDFVLESDETLTATLTHPTNSSLGTAVATGTIEDNDDIKISIADATGDEGSTASFTVSLSAISGNTVTVDFATSDNTALAGTDYTTHSGSLTFTTGQTSKNVIVNLTADAISDHNETFTVTLSNPNNATLLDGTAAGTISQPDITPPSSVTNFISAQTWNNTLTSPVFTWDANGEGDLSHYEIEIRKDSDDSSIVAWTNVGSVTTYKFTTGITQLDNNTYYANIRAIDTSGNASSNTRITAGAFNYWTVIETTAINFSLGYAHSCAIINGGLKCWGHNQEGDLGDGTTTDRPSPISTSGLGNHVEEVFTGNYRTCATHQGKIKCWGFNAYGQIGDGTTTDSEVPVEATEISADKVQSIATGTYHVCVVLNGAAKCWGYNAYGVIGDGTTTDSSTPKNVSGLSSGVQKVTVGDYHSCALVNGGVKCWGNNFYGQLGDGTATNSTTPVNVSGLTSGVTDIESGASHICALQNSIVKCWGRNYKGQLGDNSLTDRNAPITVSGLGSVQQISIGSLFSCALKDGGLKCWGFNGNGEIGDGTNTDQLTPKDVSGLTSNVSYFETGGFHACALLKNNLKCWGASTNGQLGNGTLTSESSPINITSIGVPGIQKIYTSQNHSCLIYQEAAYCWGRNNYGQLGDGTTVDKTKPTLVSGLNQGVQALSLGTDHSCALINGSVKCWGRNNSGQLGDSSFTQRLTPVQVSTLTASVSHIYAGSSHSCALKSGESFCWGDNTEGQLGDSTNTNRNVPTTVTSHGSDVYSMSVAGNHSCAIKNGALNCWGDNSQGQLGDNTTTDRNSPVSVSGLSSGVQSIALGGQHSCAIVNGGIKCWGQGDYGALGNNSTSDALTPVTPVGLSSNSYSLVSGEFHSCAINGNNTKCWGRNNSGQLGNNSTTNSLTPANISSQTYGSTYFQAGGSTTCNIHEGITYCWGANNHYQVGDRTQTDRLTPTEVNLDGL